MKLKMIALATMLAAGSANAAIDNGHSSGNGELFFNIWDANGSYTADLNVSIDAFQGDMVVFKDLGADATYNSFIAAVADPSLLMWNVVANDNSGSRRLLTTYSLPEASTTKTADVIRSATLAVTGYVGDVNAAMGSNNSVTVNAASNAYTGISSFSDTVGGKLNFSNAGTLANNSYASGLGFMRIDAGGFGIAASEYNEYFDGAAVNAWIDTDNNLHIAAVPEASTYGMMLAGLGLVGFMARRRQAP